MKVVVRLDISAHLGTGHWRRMSNLVAAIPGAEAVFVVRTDHRDSSLFIGNRVHFLAASDGEEMLVSVCAAEAPQLLLLDLLKYPPGFVRWLKNVTGRRVVTFHEYTDWDDASDLAVNYNTFEGFERSDSPSLLAGPNYCLINGDILNITRAAKTTGVLTTFGGSDPSGFTTTFIERVATHLPHLPFVIHQGPFAATTRPNARSAKLSNVHLTEPGDALFRLMATSRLAVTAGGNSMYELMYLGFVPAVVAHNDHQAEFARNAARLGACYFFRSHPTVDWEALGSLIEQQYANPPQPSHRLIDGLGTQRLVKQLMKLCE
jgi:spore coat polysaccharide biosynthesis predicted glycosyltransferase SpsG